MCAKTFLYTREDLIKQLITLHPVQSATITILADNFFDGLLPDQGVAKRASLGTQKLGVTTALMEGGQTFESPLAQHGFSLSCALPKIFSRFFPLSSGQSHRLLFDTGTTPDGLIANMHTFDISPKDIETIVLSHGHFDHTTGLDGLARTLGRTNLPVMIHPDFWNRRRIVIPGRDPFEIPTTSKSALHGVGFEVIEERQPSFLLDNALLVTGEVDRTTAFERGMPG